MSGNIAALRLKNRMYAGALTGAALQAELADAYQLGAWRQLCARGADMEQLLSVPELRAVVQASPVATDEILRSGSGVGRVLESLLESASGEMRACSSFDRAINSGTTLQQLLGSVSALEFVMASPWGKLRLISAFPKNANVSGVLSAAIDSQAALTAILGDATAAAALRASTGLPKAEVPAQAIGSVDAGASYIHSDPNYGPWLAFNKATSGNGWYGSSATNQWVSYRFASPVFVHTVSLYNPNVSGVKDAKIQCSDDGVSWVDVLQTTYTNATTEQLRYINRAGRARYWRLWISSSYHASQVGVQELNFIGFQ